MDQQQKINEILITRKLGGKTNVSTAIAAYALLDENNDEINRTTTVALNDAQIKALPTTPVVIIPPTETLNFVGFPTSVPRIISAVAMFDARNGAYHNVSDGYLNLSYGSDANGAQLGTTMKSRSNNPFMSQVGIAQDPIQQFFSFFLMDSLPLQADGFLDNAISIWMTNDDGVLTDGHADNTLVVRIYYGIQRSLTG